MFLQVEFESLLNPRKRLQILDLCLIWSMFNCLCHYCDFYYKKQEYKINCCTNISIFPGSTNENVFVQEVLEVKKSLFPHSMFCPVFGKKIVYTEKKKDSVRSAALAFIRPK